jgi:hypothetical protein
MELTVFVNGARKASASMLAHAAAGGAQGQRWPSDIWGVVDVHGTVRSVRLRGPGATTEGPTRLPPQQQQQTPVPAALPAPAAAPNSARPALGRLQTLQPAPTQELEPLLGAQEGPGAGEQAPKAGLGTVKAEVATPLRRSANGVGFEVAAGPKKRLRMTTHPCGCMVHLLRSPSGTVVHVPRKGDFVIGRNPKSCNLVLDSTEVPNMASRRHAVVVSADDAVMVVDCESLNGTFVNGRRVGRETLREGDRMVIGNPAQSPEDFQFEISMPPAI